MDNNSFQSEKQDLLKIKINSTNPMFPNLIQVISTIPVNLYNQSFESHLFKAFPNYFPWNWIDEKNDKEQEGHGISFMIKRILDDGAINRELQRNDVLLSLLFSEKIRLEFEMQIHLNKLKPSFQDMLNKISNVTVDDIKNIQNLLQESIF